MNAAEDAPKRKYLKWDEERLTAFTNAYHARGYAGVRELFPELSRGGIKNIITRFKIPRVSEINPDARFMRSALSFRTASSQAGATAKVAASYGPGSCNPGEVEHIRRRLANFVVPQLVNELGRSPASVVSAIAALASDRFAASTTVEREAAYTQSPARVVKVWEP